MQHTRLPCPSLSPRVCPSSCSFSVMSSNCLILWCSLLFLSSVFPSTVDLPSELSILIRWPKYWSFSFNISPSSEYSGLISLMIDWFDLLAVQGTFRSLFQHHSWRHSVIWHSDLFMVQLSQWYGTTRKTIALTIQISVSRVMFLVFNTQPSLAWGKNASIYSVSGPISAKRITWSFLAFIWNVRTMQITYWNHFLLLLKSH